MEKKTGYQEHKKGIMLSYEYFSQYVHPMLLEEFPTYKPRMAAVLAGEGSECYGYDDVMSQDGEFGVAYQLLIPGEDKEVYGKRLAQRLTELPDTFGNYKVLHGEKCGLMAIEDFYEKYLGFAEGPMAPEEWRSLTDAQLSTATNGKVFFDNYGKFSAIRTRLLNGYPEEERLRRIGLACQKAGKSGQYNLPRCTSRRQWVAACMVRADFMDAVSQIIFLLNRVYRPYFKWFPKAMETLPILGEEIGRNMEYFAILSMKLDKGTVVAMAENISQMIIEELRRKGITRSSSTLLEDHGREILAKLN